MLGGFIPSIVKLVTTADYTQDRDGPGQDVDPERRRPGPAGLVLPFMLPILLTGFVYWLLKRYNLNPLWAIGLVFVLGIVGGWLGWFASALPAPAA